LVGGYVMGLEQIKEHGGDQKPRGAQNEQGGVHPRGYCIEALGLELQSPRQHARSQHQQQITDNRAGNGGLYDPVQSCVECENGDNQFRGVTESSIQQTPDPRPYMF